MGRNTRSASKAQKKVPVKTVTAPRVATAKSVKATKSGSKKSKTTEEKAVTEYDRIYRVVQENKRKREAEAEVKKNGKKARNINECEGDADLAMDCENGSVQTEFNKD